MKDTALATYTQQAVDNIEAKLKFILETQEIELKNPVTPIRKPQMRQLLSLQRSEAMLDTLIKEMGLLLVTASQPEAVSEVEPNPTTETGQPEQGEPDSQAESGEAPDAESQPTLDEPSATADSDEPEEQTPDEAVG